LLNADGFGEEGEESVVSDEDEEVAGEEGAEEEIL